MPTQNRIEQALSKVSCIPSDNNMSLTDGSINLTDYIDEDGYDSNENYSKDLDTENLNKGFYFPQVYLGADDDNSLNVDQNINNLCRNRTADTTVSIQSRLEELKLRRYESSISEKKSHISDKSSSQGVKLEFHLTEYEINLIERSWNMTLEDSHTFDDLTYYYITDIKTQTSDDVIDSLFTAQFCENLVAINPDMEDLFPPIRGQGKQLLKMINESVAHLRDIMEHDITIKQIVSRYSRSFTIDNEILTNMGKAFLKTFQDRFTLLFTNELEKSWAKFYSYLANILLTYGSRKLMTEFPLEDSLNQSQNNENEERLVFLLPFLVEEQPKITSPVSSMKDDSDMGITTKSYGSTNLPQDALTNRSDERIQSVFKGLYQRFKKTSSTHKSK